MSIEPTDQAKVIKVLQEQVLELTESCARMAVKNEALRTELQRVRDERGADEIEKEALRDANRYVTRIGLHTTDAPTNNRTYGH